MVLPNPDNQIGAAIVKKMALGSRKTFGALGPEIWPGSSRPWKVVEV